MNPRRLIPLALVFLVLVGTYLGLRWQQSQKEAREQQAKQVFQYKEAEITTVSLKRGAEEIELTRQGGVWEITKPLKAKADAATMENLVQALADLKKERDLGPGDLKTFGLDRPELVVSFTAKGEQHRLSLGIPAPASRGYYTRQDEAPDIFLINTAARESLNQQMISLRDKTLWAFDAAQVKSLKIRTDKTKVALESTGANAWRQVGKPDLRLRSDRVVQLLGQLHGARINDFPPAPKDLKTVGLAPQAKTEVTLETPKGIETLFLGTTGTGTDVYARLGAQGEIVRVNKDLTEQIAKTVAGLEERRLWTASVADVGKVVWGPPGKTWTAVRDGNSWKITGPEQAEIRQSPTSVELALLDFQKLEYTSILPKASAAASPAFVLEVLGVGDKPLFRLEEAGKKGQEVELRTKAGETTLTALLPQKNFAWWQDKMAQVTKPQPSPAMPGKKPLR